MNRQYYYLVAGLPDILFEDKKIPLSSVGFREYLKDYLSVQEMDLLTSYFWRFDNYNLINRLKNNGLPYNSMANLKAEELEEVLELAKDNASHEQAPVYFLKFIEAYRNETPLFEGKSWELQLSDLYYEFVTGTENEFINSWFEMERNISNVLTAYHCRNNSIDISKQLVGTGEINEKLTRSSARDFGLSDEINHLDRILKAAEETDLLEQEKKIDFLKWEILEEESFFYFFTIEKLFVFIIKLSLAERWINLDKPTGEKMFNEILNSMETSYKFPSEFSLK